jgi:hypothetical protein
MDYATYNVVYVDRAAGEDRLVRREDVPSTVSSPPPTHVGERAPLPGRAPVSENLHTLLGSFSEGRS